MDKGKKSKFSPFGVSKSTNFWVIFEYIYVKIVLIKLNPKKLIFLIVLIFSTSMVAQDLTDIRFENIRTADGLPSYTIHEIEQDTRGFIWLATSNGLSRYDGYYFKNYFAKDFGKGLSSNVTAISQIDSNRIWLIVDKQKLVEYRQDCDCFQNLENRFVENISAIGNGYRRIKKYNNSIYLIGESTLEFSDPFTLRHIFDFNQTITDFIPVSGDSVLISQFDHDLVHMKADSFKNEFTRRSFRHLHKYTEKIPGNELLYDINGNYWSAPWKNGILKISPREKNQPKFFQLKPHRLSSDTEINAIACDHYGNIWIGSNNFGLHYLDSDKSEIFQFNLSNRFPTNISISDIFIDLAGQVWVGTKEEGVYLYRPSKNQSLNFPFPKDNSDIKVLSIFENKLKQYLIGTDQGLWSLELKASTSNLKFKSNAQIAIHSIYRNHQDTLLFGTNRGLYKWDDKTERLTNFYTIPVKAANHDLDLNNLTNTRIIYLQDLILDRSGFKAADKKNRFLENRLASSPEITNKSDPTIPPYKFECSDTLLLGVAYGHGLFYLDYKTKVFEHGVVYKNIWDRESTIETNRLNKLHIDNQNSLWVLSELNGVWLSYQMLIGTDQYGFASSPRELNYFPNIAENYNHSSLKGSTYNSDNFNDLLQINKSTYLVTSKAGELLELEIHEKHIKKLLQHDSNFLGIIQHDNSKTWIATNEGYLIFNHLDSSFQSYNKNIGIDYCGLSFAHSTDDLILGGNGGVSVVNDVSKSKLIRNENIYIKNLTVTGQDVPLSENLKKLELPYDENFIEIYLSSLDLENPDHKTYMYRLKGLHENWIATEEKVVYNDLSDGNYKLQVKYSGLPYFLNILSLKIHPPFWRQAWFIILTLGLIILSIYYFFSSRIRKLKKMADLKLKTEISAQETERKRLAQDLHDDFGVRISALKMYINTIENISQKQDSNLAKLSQSAVNLVDQSMRDLRNLLTNLSPASLREHGLIAALEELIESINRVGNIKIDFKHHYNSNSLDANVELNIFRVIQELINNSVKHSAGKQIEIELGSQVQDILITYADDGQGFDIAKIKRGYGLENIMNRTKMVEGTIKWPDIHQNKIRITIPRKYIQ